MAVPLVSDTPRTDAYIQHEAGGIDFNVMAEHARQLERELVLMEKTVVTLGVARDAEPTPEQIAVAVIAFQESTSHKALNLTTAQFVVAMVGALKAALSINTEETQ